MLLFVPPLWKQEKDYNLKKTFSDSPSGDWLTLFHRHFLTWNYVTAWPQWPCAAWEMDHRALYRIDNEKTALHTKTQFRSNIPIFFPIYLIYRVRFYQKKEKLFYQYTLKEEIYRWIDMSRKLLGKQAIWKGYLLEYTFFNKKLFYKKLVTQRPKKSEIKRALFQKLICMRHIFVHPCFLR